MSDDGAWCCKYAVCVALLCVGCRLLARARTSSLRLEAVVTGTRSVW